MKQDPASYDPLGLTRIINLIAQLDKPLITHNGILDLMFLYNSFMQPLPETVQEFTCAIHELFPHIYDTKHILNKRMQLRTNFTAANVFTLSDAFNRCRKEDLNLDQKIRLHPSFTEYSLEEGTNSVKSHEAGFDAMMTGILWFKLQSILINPIKKHFPGIQSVLSNSFIDVMDKNKLPMASIQTSLNLAQIKSTDKFNNN